MKCSIKCIICVCCLAFAGCATSKTVIGPEGKELHSINCSGTALTWGDCIEKAGQICGTGGYEIIAGGGNNVGTSVSATQYGLYAIPIVSREMIVKCK